MGSGWENTNYIIIISLKIVFIVTRQVTRSLKRQRVKMVSYDIINAIEDPKVMLTLTGVWPVLNPSFWYLLRRYITFTSTILMLVLMGLEVILSRRDLLDFSDILFLFFEYVNFTMKLFFFKWSSLSVLSLSRRLEDPMLNCYEDHHGVYVEKAIKRTNFIANAFKCSCISTVSVLSVRPYMEGTVFPVPFSLFHEGLMWYVIYFFQLVALAIGIWTHSALDTLCVGYMGIILAELDILINKIKNFATVLEVKTSQTTAEQYLHECCKHHNKIIKFVKDVEDVFTKAILVQYFSSTVIICNTGFHLIITSIFSAKFVTLVVYFSTMMIELAMYCWFGNEIILKSLEIGDACFTSDWWKFNTRTNKILFLIMERSKRPLTIRAYKFSVLSLSAYLKIINWSYSYFTVLRRLYMKE